VWTFVVGACLVGVKCSLVFVDAVVVLMLVVKVVMLVLLMIVLCVYSS
jgi:hypothetical protein